MGRFSREKGKAFERLIAQEFRRRYPEADVRRTIQSQDPWNSDVVVEGRAPGCVRALWIECQHAGAPSYRAKMVQALRDIDAARAKGLVVSPFYRTPVVIWRKTRSRDLWASLHVGDLAYVQGIVDLGSRFDARGSRALITLLLSDFVACLPEE